MPPGGQKGPKRQAGRPTEALRVRMMLSISAGMIADIDAVSAKGETRADLIRVAIEREIERRIRTHR